MRRCTKCKVKKEEIEFPFKSKKYGKRSTICGVCQREYKRAYYRRNRESHYKRNKKREQEILDFIASKRDFCVICGEDEKACLDFHHKNPSEKLFEVSVGFRRYGYSKRKLEEEIEKCAVVCSNCHRKIHAGLVTCP